MGEATGGGNSELEQLSSHVRGYPRDLLRRFTSENPHRRDDSPPDHSDEIELNLGLSLGGRFGIDPKDKRLSRSSSIGGLAMFPRDDDPTAVFPSPALTRTCSLPTVTEEEIRKRKEIQSLRRMEAKRKRSEKQKNCRASLERSYEDDKRGEEEDLWKGKGLSGNSVVANGFPWRSMNGKKGNIGRGSGIRGFAPSSQGSVGSQGSSSSGFSDFESRSIQGLSSCKETRSPALVQSIAEQIDQKPIIVAPSTPTAEKPSKAVREEAENHQANKAKIVNGIKNEMGRNVMEEMPCVSTRGDGPNGRKVEGFLYRYKNGEEVRIVCVCHGSFLSPAEFVRHAGGVDVAHPLKHIVVTPSPSSFS